MKPLFLTLAFLFATSLVAQVRIDCGGLAFTDSAGNVWAADTDVSGGTLYSVTSPISGTLNSGLFDSLRYGVFTYTIPVPNGSYNVNLEFAETWASAAGVRVFSMQVNGVTVLTNFDVFAKVGKNAADVEIFPVTVTNGSIVIQSVAVTQNPILNAIDIEPTGPPPPFVFTLQNCGASTCTFTFPMQAPPTCSASDGTCALAIQVCDTSVTPANCLTLGAKGEIDIIKTSSLPSLQILTVPAVQATSP